MQIFTIKLKHRCTAILLLLSLIIANVQAASSDEFIHLNSELPDDFYKNTHFFSSITPDIPREITKIKQGSIHLDFTHLPISAPYDWSSLMSEAGVQYAWKAGTSGQRFFDYIYSRNTPLKVATSYDQYMHNFANNAIDYNIYLGLTTVKLKKETGELADHAHFGIYKQPKLVLDFNEGILENLFTKYQGDTTFRDSNRLATARVKGLVIAGVIDGDFSWIDGKQNANDDAVVIKNSANEGSKVLYLPNDLIIAQSAKIQAGKHKTGLKITDENAVIVGGIHNYGKIIGETAVELGAKNTKFPLLTENSGADNLPSDHAMKRSNFYNSGLIQAYKPYGIAFKVIGSYTFFDSTNYVTNFFDLYNKATGEISGMLQSNKQIIFSVFNDGKITIPAEANAMHISTYTASDNSKLIIEFDDNFGNISQDAIIVNLRLNTNFSLASQIVIAKADNAKIDHSSTQKEITLLSASGFSVVKSGESVDEFDKYVNNILCAQTFIEDGKKYVIVADPEINKLKTGDELKASFKVVEVHHNAPDIIPLNKIHTETVKSIPFTKLTPAHKVIKATDLTPAHEIIKATHKTIKDTHKTIKASELTPAHKMIEASQLTPAHKIIEYLPFNKNTPTSYYKDLIAKIKHAGTIKKLHITATNNIATNNHGYFSLAKGIDVQQMVTVLDDINADTEISHQHSLVDKITFEYLDNIKKSRHLKAATYDLTDSTLYLGLTTYKNLHSHQYALGLFNYISKDHNPAFEFDLGYPDGFNKVAMFNNKVQLKSIVVTSILDSTSSQQAALLIANSSNVDKSLNLAKGLIIANTGKLIASNKNNSQAALVIVSNKEKSMHDAIHTTGNEKLITKHLMSGGIYNYGLISGNLAINIGEHGYFFPLKADNDSAFLNNYGQITSNNIAVKISGEQTDFTKNFNLTNQQQGIIEGRIQAEKNFASNSIEFNVVNHGIIKIPAESNSICVSNYKNIKASSLIIEFKEGNINPNDAILNIGKHADFELDSNVILDFANYDVNLAEHDIIHVPLLYSQKFTGNKDQLFSIKPIINDDEYILYNVIINQHVSSNDELELEIISKEVFDLEQEHGIIKSFPSDAIKVTNIANKIKTLKMLAKKNKTHKEQQVKKIHDAFIKTHAVNHALEYSKSPEEYMDYILPNNSSPAQLANQKIFGHVTSQIYSRIMNRNIYSKYFYLQKSATNFNIEDYMHNAELWTSTSYHLWNHKATSSFKNKIKNYLLTIGCDYELANDTIVGISYGISHTNSMMYSEQTNITKTQDTIITHSFSAYSRFNLKMLDGIAIVSRNDNNHNVEIQNNKKPEFKSVTYALNVGTVYTTAFYDFHLDLAGLIGLSSVHVAEHQSQYDDPSTHKPVKILQQSDILTNISIGSTIYNKVYLDEMIFLDYSFGIMYKFLSGPKVNQTDSNLINSHRENSHLPSKHSINLNILTKLFLNEHAAIEFTLDGTIEKNSVEYGAAFAFRYLF